MRLYTLLTWLLFIGASHMTWSADPPLELEFAKIDEHSLKLDLYLPDKPTEQVKPVIVWVHGGAWRAGSRSRVPVLRWLEHGFAIASVDYRLSTQAQFPAQVHDIKAAIRYLRAHSETHQFDQDKIIIAGASAGGHLAALVGVSNRVEALEGTIGDCLDEDSSVQAIVSFYGASNLQTILSQSTAHGLSVRVPALELLLGGQPEDRPELARLASPVAHVDKNDPPLWLIHGDADPQMPFKQSQELESAYKSQKLSVELDVIRGGKHGGAEFYEPARLDRLAVQILKL